MKTQSSFIIFRPDPILKSIIESASKSYGNRLFLKLVRLTTLSLGSLLSTVAVLCIFDSFLQMHLFSEIFLEMSQVSAQKLQAFHTALLITGAFLLFISSLFLGIAYLSKRLLNRLKYQQILQARQAELDQYVASQDYVQQENEKMSEELNLCRA